jgi:hypothetical protein
MKLYYYNAEGPNFGDALNPFLWNALLPGFFDSDPNELFLGIGSILYDRFPINATKIVFGSGYGGYTRIPQLDSRWYVHFVRGPRTARLLGLNPQLGIGDAAILIRTLEMRRLSKRHRLSLIPHHGSMRDGLWDRVAAQAGVHLIDPRRTVEEVVEGILSSEFVLCEAMHGAIVADAMRIPWIPLLPIDERHRLKWYDWADSLNLHLRPLPLSSSCLLEFVASSLRRYPQLLYRLSKRRLLVNRCFPAAFVDRAAQSVLRAAQAEPMLSNDALLDDATEQMLDHIRRLQRYGAKSVSPCT